MIQDVYGKSPIEFIKAQNKNYNFEDKNQQQKVTEIDIENYKKEQENELNDFLDNVMFFQGEDDLNNEYG